MYTSFLRFFILAKILKSLKDKKVLKIFLGFFYFVSNPKVFNFVISSKIIF